MTGALVPIAVSAPMPTWHRSVSSDAIGSSDYKVGHFKSSQPWSASPATSLHPGLDSHTCNVYSRLAVSWVAFSGSSDRVLVVHGADGWRQSKSLSSFDTDLDEGVEREYVSSLWSEDWDSPEDDIYDTW